MLQRVPIDRREFSFLRVTAAVTSHFQLAFRRRGYIFSRMPRERYIARSIQHWHVVRIGADGKETVMEITDSEEEAKAEAARLDRDAERTYRAGETNHS